MQPVDMNEAIWEKSIERILVQKRNPGEDQNLRG